MKSKYFLCIILSLSILNGCSKHDELETGKATVTEEDVTLLAKYENLTKKSQEALLEKLDDNNIDYVIDNQGSVFVNKKDMDKAISCCKQ
ncbi:hypothetical protein [Lysinibacillus fusiformis]|uniref:hypothetical protein n=1 Tax=Lysinibacillus fusiformis TaxID=28031 RepID=UPI000D3B3BD0|nr:hypothetical protein [Lysinibacillus fusiformis]MED4672438.1 hypothetical protein [Lysinibacillus fusiformis]RDV25820.1 hypothetical protein C7B90_21745 [Lysinibacillus fusiformis]GED66244.1 hypothetical protein LFU01_46960 [Lysinibacillus fusiformis]